MHEMGIYEHTSTKWAQECRDMCMEICFEKGEPIGGANVEVEIDETKIGNFPYLKINKIIIYILHVLPT